MGSLERADLVGMLQRQTDIVQAMQQAMLAKGVDLEPYAQAAGTPNFLSRQIDRQPVALARCNASEK